jgi:hypothetical protein
MLIQQEKQGQQPGPGYYVSPKQKPESPVKPQANFKSKVPKLKPTVKKMHKTF